MQLCYHAYMNSTGYSISAQDNILAMMQVKPDINIKVNYINVRLSTGISSNRRQIFTALNKKELFDSSIHLFHSIPARYKKLPNNKSVGFCVYETIDPPSEWVKTMNTMDIILTPSHFNKHVFENSGVKVPVHVTPHCFDPRLFNKNTRNYGRYDRTTFISIGTWKERKNWKTLIKGWYEAFEYKNNVCLLIKTNKPKELAKEVEHIKQTSEWRSKNTAPIYCDKNAECDFEDIPQFLRKGDIFVSPSLGEGFLIPGLHAMALGIPIIITRFGGSLEYAKQEFCTYFEPKKYQRVAKMDGIPQFVNKIWPLITVEEVANKLVFALKNKKLLQQKAEKAYDYVHENFSYQAIGSKFIEILGAI